MKQTRNTDTDESIQLPATLYTDAGVLEHELSDFFTNNWISVAVGAQVPRPGDVYPLEVAGQLLLITRAEDGTVHVFNNICRHRGTKLVKSAGSHRNGLITCPYHTWSYSLDGALQKAPYWDRSAGSAPDKKTMKSLALNRIKSALWFDTIFVNISGTAEPFEVFIKPLSDYWASVDQTQLRPSMLRTDYQPQSNWKLVCENFLDGYHVPWVHSQIGSPEAGIDFKTAQYSEDIFGAFIPRGKSERPRSTKSLPGFEKLSDDLKNSHHFLYLFPNTLVGLAPEWFQVISVFPDSVDASSENLAFYLVGDAALDAEYADLRSAYNEQMALINEQDMTILADQQAARRSKGMVHCTFAPHWDELAKIFHARLARAYNS
ncbi:MAG: choline monooxygenase [Planctomycetota bacterium]|jgi:choline monooxygenase